MEALTVSEQHSHIRHVVYHYFHRGSPPAKTLDEITKTYGSGITSLSTVNRWFRKFKLEGLKVKDRPRIGRPKKIDTNKIIAIVNQRADVSFEEIRKETGYSKGSISEALKQIRFVKKLDKCVPTQLYNNELN